MPQKRRPLRKVGKWEDLPLTLSLADMCVILNESRETVRKMCATDEIPAIKIGGKWKISRDLLRNYIERAMIFNEAVSGG